MIGRCSMGGVRPLVTQDVLPVCFEICQTIITNAVILSLIGYILSVRHSSVPLSHFRGLEEERKKKRGAKVQESQNLEWGCALPPTLVNMRRLGRTI